MYTAQEHVLFVGSAEMWTGDAKRQLGFITKAQHQVWYAVCNLTEIGSSFESGKLCSNFCKRCMAATKYSIQTVVKQALLGSRERLSCGRTRGAHSQKLGYNRARVQKHDDR